MLFSCLILLACSKNNGENQNLNPNGQHPFDFMSIKAGSWWRYGVRNGVTVKRFARGKDSVKMGLTYQYFERQDESNGSFQPEYFAKNENKYLTLVDLDGTETNYVNYLFYKDGAVRGNSWTNTGVVNSPIGNVNVRIETGVAETDLTMNIGTQDFTNTVHVHSDMKGGPFNTALGTLDIWFVKGLGILREELNVDIPGQYTTRHVDSLLDYHIEP
jgi:hypothetical protein